MRRLIPTCLVALGLAAVPLSAQESTTKSTTTVKTDDAKVTTLTGCVAGGPSSFTLTKVAAANTSSEKPSDAPSPVGTSGIASSYTLSARGGVDLTEHVGKKVEVTGVAMPAAAKGDDDAKISVSERTEVKRDDAPDEKAESKSSAEIARGPSPTFAVVSVKMVAGSCD